MTVAPPGRGRRTTGLVLGPLLAFLVLAAPLHGLTPEAHRLAAVTALVIVFWVAEALPLSVTAVLGALLMAVLRISPPRQALAAFVDPVIWLFVGSFALARTIAVHRLDQRMAYALLDHPWVAGSTTRTLWTIGLAAWLLAMWVGITASVAILLPVALALARAADESAPGAAPRYGTGLLLLLVYAASAGAMATPIGTPPNLIGLALIQDVLGRRITFIQWMAFALPLAAVLLLVRYAMVLWLFRPEVRALPTAQARMHRGHVGLGGWTDGQRRTALVFGAAALGWIAPGFAGAALQDWLPPGAVALGAAALLLLAPAGPWTGGRLLPWREAARIDWGTILLFGGGIALGRALFDTGLSNAVGSALLGLPGADSSNGLTALVVGATTALSELVSNTAASNMIIPVALSTVTGDPARGLQLAVASALAASQGFMLPVSTPGNAMIYGAGRLRLGDLVRTGLLVDLTGMAAVWAASVWLVPAILR